MPEENPVSQFMSSEKQGLMYLELLNNKLYTPSLEGIITGN